MPRRLHDTELSKPNPELQEFAQEMAWKAKLSDFRLLHAMQVVDRKNFVPHALRERAYSDEPLPLLTGESGDMSSISQPSLTIKMIDLLRLSPKDKVLEIGTGSGYSAGLMAQLSRQVTTIEYVPELATQAQKNLSSSRYKNVTVLQGDGASGYNPSAPYNAIVSTVGMKSMPDSFIAQLAEGGRVLIPAGENIKELTLTMGQKTHGQMEYMELGEVYFVPIITENEKVGWSITAATALLGLVPETRAKLTLAQIAEQLGLSPAQYYKIVLQALGLKPNTPISQLEGIAGWLQFIREPTDKRYRNGDF